MITYRYGKCHLQLARTQQCSFSQKRDPSYTDAMYTEYDIGIKGFLANSEGIFPGVNGMSNVDILNALKRELSTPRLSMEYRIDNTVVVSTTGMDAAKGPDPYEVRVTEISGGIFFVEIRVKVSVVDCTDNCAGERTPILSLRWSQTETFDENWYSNLVTDGHLIVRSDLLQSADNFRPLATPPLLPDYKRKVSKYTLSPDGLTLDFHFEDQEYDRLPPFPATKASGRYTVQIERPGVKRVGTVNIHLEGQKGTDRKALFIRACGMGYSKLQKDQLFSDPRTGKTVNIIWGRFQEDLFEPVVDVELSALLTNVSKGGVVQKNGDGNLAVSETILSTAASIASPVLSLGVQAGQLIRDRLRTGGLAGSAATPGSLAAATGTGPAPVAIGSGASDDAARFIASVMPSVGDATDGLLSGRPGIAPPDRKRLAGLLTAMFRDPCLCIEPTGTDTELRTTPGFPSNARNTDMVSGVPIPVTPSPESGNVASSITIGLTTGGAVGNLQDLAVYDTYEIEMTTDFDTGKVQMPGTGVGASAGVATLVSTSGGMMRVTTAWVASRSGKPPQLPSFISPDPNVTAIKGSIVSKDVAPTPDGASLTYMVSGYYVHAVSNPSTYQMNAPVAPMLSQEVRVGGSIASSFWTQGATWVNYGGFAGGLILATNSNPFGGVNTTVQPVAPPGFLASQAAASAGMPDPGLPQFAIPGPVGTVVGPDGSLFFANTAPVTSSSATTPDNESYNFPFPPQGAAGGIYHAGEINNASFYFPPNR